MDKQAEFLEIIRTAILVREIRIATGHEQVENFKDVRIHEAAYEMARAIRASRRIPGTVTAEDAAQAYLALVLAAPRETVNLPDWLDAA